MRTNKIMLLTGILMNFWNMTLIKRSLGIPWWSSGWTSCSHCRGPRFNPWLGNYDPKSHTAHSKSKKTNKQTKHILYGSIYMFPPTLPYMSFEIRCNESMVAKLALCLPLERVPGRNTGELLGVVIASLKWKCYPSWRWTSSVWLGACWLGTWVHLSIQAGCDCSSTDSCIIQPLMTLTLGMSPSLPSRIPRDLGLDINGFRTRPQHFLATLRSIWDLSSLIRDGPWVPCIGSTES